MTKNELTKQIKAIARNYEAIDPEGKDLISNQAIKKYVGCLNNPDMKAHLLKTGIAQDEAEAEEWLPEFETPKDFINMYKYSLEAGEENGLIQINEERKKEYHSFISKNAIDKQGQNASMAICQLHGKTTFNDGTGLNVKGLDGLTISETIEKQEALLAKGDLTSLENMLLSQTHTLNAIFTNMVNKMAGAEYLHNLEVYGRIALKAQNQTRHSASTLAEIKGIKKTTFIHQVNQAHNQQVNNGARENLTNSANEKVIDNVDRRSETTGMGQNQSNATLAISENTRGTDEIFNECLKTRDEVSPVERVRESVSTTQ